MGQDGGADAAEASSLTSPAYPLNTSLLVARMRTYLGYSMKITAHRVRRLKAAIVTSLSRRSGHFLRTHQLAAAFSRTVGFVRRPQEAR